MKFLTSNTYIKSVNNKGEISGYASVFNVVDGYNDVIIKGAFSKTIENFEAGKKPKLLWQHDATAPIGIIEELYEDDYGLFIKTRLLLEIPKAQEAYLLLKNKAIDGFSIGYKIRNRFFNSGLQYISDIDLLEISIVTFPACEKALVGNVKSDNQSKYIASENLENKTYYINFMKMISNKLKNIQKDNNNG